MVGNAVPPRLAWYLAIQMKKAFADQMTISKEEKSQVQQTIKQVPVIKIAEQYPKHIVNNSNLAFVKDITGLELDKRVLISLVKPDNVEHYIDHSAKVYYTGKKFPTTVALNKLYYFNVSSTNILYNKVSCLSFAISTVCTRMDGFFGK